MGRNHLLLFAGLVAATPAAAQEAHTVQDALRVIPPAAPATSGGASGPTPATDPATWVTTDDYPAWAAQHGIAGSVGFVLDIDSDGSVTGCEVRRSSGIPDLDRIACEKVTERGRFLPARDNGGNPVSSKWSTRVVWTLPEPALPPVPEPGQFVASWVVERDGSVSECTVELIKGIGAEVPEEEDVCGEIGFEPIVDDGGKPQRRRIRITTRVDHEPLP